MLYTETLLPCTSVSPRAYHLSERVTLYVPKGMHGYNKATNQIILLLYAARNTNVSIGKFKIVTKNHEKCQVTATLPIRSCMAAGCELCRGPL